MPARRRQPETEDGKRLAILSSQEGVIPGDRSQNF
jgi:hypothetical protein